MNKFEKINAGPKTKEELMQDLADYLFDNPDISREKILKKLTNFGEKLEKADTVEPKMALIRDNLLTIDFLSKSNEDKVLYLKEFLKNNNLKAEDLKEINKISGKLIADLLISKGFDQDLLKTTPDFSNFINENFHDEEKNILNLLINTTRQRKLIISGNAELEKLIPDVSKISRINISNDAHKRSEEVKKDIERLLKN